MSVASSTSAATASKPSIATSTAGTASTPNSKAFSEALKGASENTETTSSTVSTTTGVTKPTETTNSKSTILLAGGAAILLLLAIGFVIARDARRVAPATEGESEERDIRAAKERALLLQKRRAKAKVARQSRKRNTGRAKR